MQFSFRRKDYCITTPAQFKLLYESNQKIFSKRVTVFFRQHGEGLQEKCKMAFVAGKKVGGAVVRNRSKRLMREAVRLNRHSISQDCDYVFSAKPMLVGTTLSDVQNDIKYMLKKQGLWKTNV